jgi:hypothetical protein
MSSEESDVEDEDIEMIYHVKRLPWRRNIDKELALIDSTRILDAKNFSKQGAKPARRRRGEDIPASVRGPVVGLPRPFYDNEWFGEVPHRELQLRIPREPFQWINLVVGPA